MAYTPNVPLVNQTIAASRPIINANFQYLNTIFQVDHTFNDSAPTEGLHKKVTFSANLTSTPSLTGAVAALFTKTVSGSTQLFWNNGGTDQQITFQNQNGALALNGSMSIAGGATVNIPVLPNFSMGECFFVRSGDSGWCTASFMNVSGLTPRIQINGQNVGNKIFYQGNNLAIQNSDSTATYHYAIIYYLTV